jgi:RNA polymerase sigma-B factor
MHGSRQPTRRPQRLEDLDEVAAAYARRWTQADTQGRSGLRDDLIRRCLPLADRMAGRYRGRTEPIEDLEQVARVGLIHAVDRYDPGRGSFTAFAVITICGEIKRHFRDKTWAVHVNRRLQDHALQVGAATTVLTQTLARAPDSAELADYLNVTEPEVRRAQQCAAVHTPLLLSMPVGDDDAAELGDLIGAVDESMEALPDTLTVIELVRTLPPRIQHIIALRFAGELAQAQIAADLGISQMQVCRLLQQTMTWLRTAMLSDVAPPWAGVDDCHGPGSLRVRVASDAAAVTLTVHGEVDRDTADRLRRHLHSAIAAASAGAGSAGRLVVDMTGVPFIDAAGVAVLRDAYLAAALAHVTVALTGVQRHVAAVLATMGLHPYPEV